jgi:chemotaxis protein histidine kinase CheA
MTQARRGSRLLTGWAALLLAVQPAVAFSQDRVQLNAITRVEVKGNTVEITGSKKPSFTTFTLSDPPRLVIDVSEAVFVDVPKEQKIGAAGITGIKTTTFGSESAAIARILIGFEQEVEADIATDGTTLIVKLPPDPGEQKRLAQAKIEAERQARLAKEAEEKAKLEAEKAARAEAERIAREEAEKKRVAEAEEAKARAEAERLAKLEAERAEKERRRKEAEEAKARAEAERLAKLEAERAEKERRRKEAEEAKARAEAERLAKLEAERAEQERKRKEAEEAKARAEAEKLRRQKELEAVAARTPSPAELAASGRKARVTFVGFKQHDGVGKIFLRTTSAVRYSVGENDARQVVVTLEKTEIDLPNNERILDTSFFDTAVSLVKPEALDDERVRVTISLKQAVAYRASQQGNELVLEFERPE